MKVLHETSYYVDNPIRGDRLDFVYNNPYYDDIKHFRNSSKSIKFANLVSDFQYGFTASGQDAGNIKFINIQNLNSLGNIEDEEVNYIDDCPDTKKLKIGDILISRSRLVGRAALVTEANEGDAYGSYIIKFTLKDNISYLGKFIVQYINSLYGQTQIDMLCSGSNGYNINSSQLLDISLPNISESLQQNIIEKIEPYNARINDIRIQYEGLLDNAISNMLYFLGYETSSIDTDLFFKCKVKPSSNFYILPFNRDAERLHYLYNDPKYNLLKEFISKINTVALSDACKEKIHRGKQPEYSLSESGCKPVLKTVDLKNWYIDYDSALSVTREFFESKTECQVCIGDVLIASTGYISLGKVDVVEIDEDALVDGHISIVRLNPDYDPLFVCYFLRSIFGQLQFERLFTGSSGQIEVKPDDLGSFRIPSSLEFPVDKQKVIAEHIKKLYAKALILKRDVEIEQENKSILFARLINNAINI